MQFSLAVAAASAFYFASSAVASSATISTLNTVFVSLNKTVGVDLSALSTSVTQAKGSVSATALIQIEAAITTNLGAIVSALVAAESTISAATISGVTASTTAVSGLVQSDINTLESDVDLLITCIQNIHTTITAIVNVGGNVRLLAKAELTVLKATIQPFVNPLQVYVAAVLTSYAKAGVTVSGLTTAQTDLKTAISSLASTAL